MYKSLYRKYRPQTFDEVCGQEHITSVLKYQSANYRLSHAYIFTGTRGTGKTTCAKILAKAANCLNPLNGNPCLKCENCLSVAQGTATDIIEMDAASNNGVDDVREIRDAVQYMPAMLKKRVYIIDEVHMLSSSAFNAILKPLEEPPEHVMFILATTEIHKLPATIVSRCQRYDFNRLPVKIIASRLEYIAECEKIKLTSDAALLLAKLAQGGMRDAISLFELCASAEVITEQRIVSLLGTGDYYTLADTAKAITDKDFETIFKTVDKVASSRDVSAFISELTEFYRDMLVCKTLLLRGTQADVTDYLELTAAQFEALHSSEEKFTKQTLLWHCRVLDNTLYDMTRLPKMKRVLAELAFVKMTDDRMDNSDEAVLSRLSALEDKVKLLPYTAEAAAENVKTVIADAPLTEKPEKILPPDIDKVEKLPESSGQSSEVYIDCWSEVLDRIGAADAGVRGLLDSSKAVLNNGGVEIKTPISFAIMMLDTQKNAELIINSLRLCGVEVKSGSKIKYTTIQNDVEADDDIFNYSNPKI